MDNRKQAKLYYLYMMSDGDVSDGETELFDKICAELCLDADDKKSIMQECIEIVKNKNLTCIEVAEKNAEEAYIDRILDIGLNEYASEQSKANILWNLINLGYADSYFTFNEREIVDFLRKYWKIPDSLYHEMLDIAETCLALEKHRLWIEGLPDTKYRSEKLRQVKDDFKYVQETIFTTISEIDF